MRAHCNSRAALPESSHRQEQNLAATRHHKSGRVITRVSWDRGHHMQGQAKSALSTTNAPPARAILLIEQRAVLRPQVNTRTQSSYTNSIIAANKCLRTFRLGRKISRFWSMPPCPSNFRCFRPGVAARAQRLESTISRPLAGPLLHRLRTAIEGPPGTTGAEGQPWWIRNEVKLATGRSVACPPLEAGENGS